MNSPIAILTATALEQEPLRTHLGDHYASHRLLWHIGGMGAGATAAATLRIIRDQRPCLIIQAGVAGALPRKHLTVCDTALAGSDYQADIGAWRPETGCFEPFDTLPEAAVIKCPYAEPLREHFRIVPARSANTACPPLPLRSNEAMESMEGAAFFAVCQTERIPFLQLRSISNRVGDPRDLWHIPEALESLTAGLAALLGNLPEHLSGASAD